MSSPSKRSKFNECDDEFHFQSFNSNELSNSVIRQFPSNLPDTFNSPTDNSKMHLIKLDDIQFVVSETREMPIAIPPSQVDKIPAHNEQETKVVPPKLGKRPPPTSYDEIIKAPPENKGLSLSTLINYFGTPSISVSRYIVFNILKAIAAYHNSSIAHMNLQLSNIYLSYTVQKQKFNMRFTNFKDRVRGENEIKELYYNKGDQRYYNADILGHLAYPKQRDIYSIGVISFILIFGIVVPLKSENVPAFSLLKMKNGWCKRPNWRDLNKYLKDKGELPSNNKLLKDFLCKLLSKCNFSATELLKHDWLKLHNATKEEITNYAMFQSLVREDSKS